MKDARASVLARRWRTFALVAAVSVAVGLAVGTFGLSTTAQAQVSDAFDARENRQVTIEHTTPSVGAEVVTTGWTPASQEQKLRDLRRVAGVEFAAILSEGDQAGVTSSPRKAPELASVLSAQGDIEEATQSEIRWARGAQATSGRRVLVGTHAATNLDVGPINALPTVWIDGLAYPVVGIIDASSRMPQLTGSILVLDADVSLLPESTHEQTLLTVNPGAAAQAADQARLVVDPAHPESLRVSVPQDPRDLRAQIESSVATSLAVLSLVALAAAILALANAMTLAVSSRRSEFGLRRAVGASPRDLFTLVLVEASLVGVGGGVLGLVLGYVAVFTVTIINRWTPVIEPGLIPLALVGGILVGALAGMTAANHAARVDPALALRM